MSLTTRLPPSACPGCGGLLDAAGMFDDDDAVPGPGDFTVCLKCGTTLVFNHDYSLRLFTAEMRTKLTPAEAADLDEVERTVARFREWQRRQDK